MNFRKALRLFAGRASALEEENVALTEALGRISTEDVRAPLPNPPFANSRWDGFAVIAKDLKSANSERPVSLLIDRVNPILAGTLDERRLRPGHCCAIMSGAPLPEGADAVVKFEDVCVKGDRVEISWPLSAGDGVVKAGSFWEVGEVLVERGRRINASDLFKLAEAGLNTVKVYRRPKVGILAIGNELIEPGKHVRKACRYAGVQYFIEGLALSAGMEIVHCDILKDDLEELIRVFRTLSEGEIDLIVTIGGTGQGLKDLVAEAWKGCGSELIFRGLSLLPGKSSSGGTTGNTLWLSLPGGVMGAVIVFMEVLRVLESVWYGASYVNSFEVMLGEDVEKHEQMHRGVFGRIENRKGTLIFLPNRQKNVNFRDVEGYIIAEPGRYRIRKGSIFEFVTL